MSHMTLEYSANLRAGGNFGELCRQLAQRMVGLQADAKPVFPAGGVRVRAVPCEDFCIADGSIKDAGFVHAILKIGAGRSAAVKQATCDGLFEIMKAHFADQFARQGLALSLELSEFSEAGTLKHNNLHARFKRT
jgi:5-carboxymethyl-2-hydroxymuconate isomerase